MFQTSNLNNNILNCFNLDFGVGEDATPEDQRMARENRYKVPDFKPRAYNEVEDLQNNSEDEGTLAALKEQQAKRRQREAKNERIYIDDVDEDGNLKPGKRDKFA